MTASRGSSIMHESVAAPAWVMLAYLIAGICFILALRGLSSRTARGAATAPA